MAQNVGAETSSLLGTQNVDNVTITGGAITNTSLGNKTTRSGTFTLNGTTPVAVTNTTVAITDAIVMSLNTVGGTVGVQPHVATITAASGFTVVGTASDTSIMNYTLIATV